MSSRIFAENAPAYWEAGYSPIPLDGKRAIIERWSSFCDNLPKPEKRAEWLTRYPAANIGLALGKELVLGHRFGAIDVDDARFVRAAEVIVGPGGPAKVGKKGRTFFCHFQKVKDFRSSTLRTGSGAHAVDVLVGGRQTVVPPSIHPDTGTEYQWVSKPLLSYRVDELPQVSHERFALFAATVGAAEAEQLASGSGTHDAGLVLAAKLVPFSSDDSLVGAVISALFPEDYSGNGLAEVDEWVASARAKGFDRVQTAPIDVAVARAVQEELAPLKYTARDGFLRYHDGFWDAVGANDVLRALKAQLTVRLGPKSTVASYLPKAETCLLLDVEDPHFGSGAADQICLRNGTLVLREGSLVPHSPDHHLRFALGIDWEPEATCPVYEQQLQVTLRGDQKAIDAFEEFAGLTLVAEQKFQRAVFLMGEGGSGKSTLLRTIQMMHDPRAVSVTPLDKLEDDRYRTDIAGKLVNISYDVQTGNRIFGETFVRITGSDPIAVRRLFKEVEGMVQPTVRFVGSMNPDMPPYQGAPDALRRRLIILSCGDRVETPDADRPQKLEDEKPGILVRWVAALKRLYDRGHFDPPESSKTEVNEYLLAYEPFGAFLEDRLMPSNTEFLPVADVTAAFNDWANANQEKPVSPNVGGRKIKKHGYKSGQGKVGPTKTNTRVVYATWKRPPPVQRF